MRCMNQNPRVSLRAISEKTGVTRMAVSLALRGKPGVSAATRDKVVAAARELGYAPDPEVSKLMAHIRSRSAAQPTACLALLTSGPTETYWLHSATERKYIEGATARAQEYGFRLEEFWLHKPGMTPARLSSIIWNRGIEGVLVAPLHEKLARGGERVLAFDFEPFAAVEISETIDKPDLDRAAHDQYNAMHRVLDEHAALNYQRPGLVLEEALDLRVGGKWTAAYLQRSLRNGLKLPPLIMADPNPKEFGRWRERHEPDVVISVDGCGLKLLQADKSKIPARIGYCTLDVDGESALHSGVSGIDQNSLQLGASAVDLLVAAIHRGQRGVPPHPVRTLVEGSWVAGTSTRAQRSSARPARE